MDSLFWMHRRNRALLRSRPNPGAAWREHLDVRRQRALVQAAAGTFRTVSLCACGMMGASYEREEAEEKSR
jgi:hypothetical protein